MVSTLKRIRQAQDDVRFNKTDFTIILKFEGRPIRAETLKRQEWTEEALLAYIKRACKGSLRPEEVQRFCKRLQRGLNNPYSQTKGSGNTRGINYDYEITYQ